MKLLLVEDELALAEALCSVFSKENYITDHCDNGVDGLNNALTGIYDAVVLDVMLPGMNGFEILREMRKNKISTPVIMLTAKSQLEDKIYGLDSGADDYMTKPIDEEEMLLRIKALLRRAQIASERKMTIGEVVLDYDALTVTRNDETQELPQKEFLLLYKLLSYPGKIFTRIQLMDEIWGADSETGWETVTVHIGRLRRRFEGWEEFSIESVRGLGYKAVKKV